MSESDTPSADPTTEPVAPATEPIPGGLPANDPAGEGASQAEIDKALKSSGIKLPDNPPAAAAVDDEEEGDDPDAEAADVDANDPEEEKPEPKPAAKKAEAPAAEADDKYSFQVEDASGVTYKITAEADIEDVLKEFEPKNNGQIIKILDQLREVKDLKKADDVQAEQDQAAQERRTRASEILSGWQDEAKALQGDKRIPEGDDGDKRINQVYKYMNEQNDARIKAGKPSLNSFEDALDKLENKEARDKAVADAKAEKDTARANGGKVGGASAPASTAPPVHKVGSARNAAQALRNLGLLE